MRTILCLLSCVMCARASEGQARSEVDPIKSLASMLAISDPATAFQAPGTVGTLSKTARATASPRMQAPADLKEQAKALNPVVGYWDPLELGAAEFWGDTTDATVGFLRHSELKHGRVAMAAFVGYCIQSNGISFPWKLTSEISFADIAAAGSPPEQWAALPTVSKWQIMLFIGFLEAWSESHYILEQDGTSHYMRGGKPGKFPSFNELPHPVPFNLYDPFKLNKGKSREALDKSLLAEVNNGRLAMIGIMGFLAEQKIPGAVPFLNGLVKPYDGNVMSPFTAEEWWWNRIGECNAVAGLATPDFCKR